MSNTTNTLNLDEALGMFYNEGLFQEIIHSGKFIFLENIYVLDKPRYVYRINGQLPCLTEYARSNYASISLAFNEMLVHTLGSKRSGEHNVKNYEQKRRKTFDYKNQKDEPSKEIAFLFNANMKRFEENGDYRKTCWQCIGEILEREHAMPESFMERTLLDIGAYYKAKRGDKALPSRHTIMAIAVGYNIGLAETEFLMKLAGFAFSPNVPEHNMHVFILVSMCEYNIDAVNDLLAKKKFRELGLKQREEKK